MSGYAFEAECEMWDAIAGQDRERARREEERPAAADELVDEYQGGQLGLAVPGEQVSALRRPFEAPIPRRCVAHDRYHDCPLEVRP